MPIVTVFTVPGITNRVREICSEMDMPIRYSEIGQVEIVATGSQWDRLLSRSGWSPASVQTRPGNESDHRP